MTQYLTNNESLVAALSIIKSETTPTKAQRESVLAAISEESDDWIQKKPLLVVALLLIALHQVDSLALTEARLAALTRRLTNSELGPGGPYQSDSYNLHLTNVAIQKLLRRLGISLEPLNTYLSRSRASKLNDLEKKILGALQREVLIQKKTALREDEEFSDRVMGETQVYLLGINPIMAPFMKRMIEKVKSVDVNGEVSRLARDFYQSIAKKPPFFTDKILVDIGVANYCAWIGYAIYDDFIDDEGKPDLLPIANVAHRYSVTKYQQVARELGVSIDPVIHSFDSVDIGSSVELRDFKAKIIGGDIIEIHTVPKYADYAFLSERALGFLAGPLLILETLSTISEDRKRHMKRGLSAYLEARQLSDDLMDWRSDLYSGRLSSVVTRTLIAAEINPSTYKIHDIAKVLSAQLWKSGFIDITKLIRNKARKAGMQIRTSAIFAEDAPFYSQYLEPITEVASALENGHLAKNRFLEVYRRN